MKVRYKRVQCPSCSILLFHEHVECFFVNEQVRYVYQLDRILRQIKNADGECICFTKGTCVRDLVLGSSAHVED